MVDLFERARGLLARPRRTLLGVCGAPGAGKSTVAELLRETLGPQVVVVPMDGFHLADDELARLGRSDRKGAPDTFDVDAYVALLRRIRDEPEQTVTAPRFDRDRERTASDAIAVRPDHRLVVTEGNYLLLDAPGWRHVREALDECWFVQLDGDVRRQRLIDRHVQHGRTREAATEWVLRSDEANALLVADTRDHADLVVELDELSEC